MTCPICQQRPLKQRQVRRRWRINKTCGERACLAVMKGQHSKAHGMWQRATAASRQAYDARWRALLQFQFGRLSERELAIFRATFKIGYSRGYNAQRARPRKAA